MKPYVGYTRVSRIGRRKDTLISHDEQRRRISEYAATRGVGVEMLPEESDISGGKSDRPILQRALRGIEDGTYRGIVVAQLDRLSRMQLVDALTVIRRVEEAGGEVLSAAESGGELERNIFLSMANEQLRRYGLQFASSKQRAVENGIWPFPKAPLGYAVTRRRDGGDGRLTPDPTTCDRVIRAFRARAAGEPWRAVADILGRGTSGAAKIIRNRAYLGEIHLGDLPPNHNAHEPLVERALWEAAQLEHPRPPRRTDGRPALLAGLVRCAGCGGSMTPNTNVKHGHVERIYRCSANNKVGPRCPEDAIISQRKLDPYVERIALTEIGKLKITAKQRNRAVDDAVQDLEAAQGELDAFQAVTRVTDVGPEAFASGMKSRADEVDRARARLAHARSIAAAVPEYGTLRRLWPKLSVEERRHVLRGSLGVVYVRKGRGPVQDRVRLTAAGFTPRRGELVPLPVAAHLEGEVRAASA